MTSSGSASDVASDGMRMLREGMFQAVADSFERDLERVGEDFERVRRMHALCGSMHTTEIDYRDGSDSRVCYSCGQSFSCDTFQDGGHEDHEFSFCPNCGAKVVRRG